MPSVKRLAIATFTALTTLSHLAMAQTPTFTTLYALKSIPDGQQPYGGLVAHAGLLYGVSNTGGTTDHGTVYAINPKTGVEKIVYSFKGDTDGSAPECELIVVDDILYGTTSFGGASNAGTVFKVNPKTGAESVIYSFGATATDGTAPAAGLVAQGGFLFGTTTSGGTASLGTVFAVSPTTGTETVVHNFVGGADGSEPFAPMIVQNGILYGTTFFGGPSNDGTVFAVDPQSGEEAVVHAFQGKSFEGNPSAGLTAHGGILFGTLAHGGLNQCGGSRCGSVFRLDPKTGEEATVFAFRSQTNGEDPEGGLVYKDDHLYGTTQTGGHVERGTLFSIDPDAGTMVRLHVFKGSTDGSVPGTLIYNAGAFYGTTRGGGAGFGTVFKIVVPEANSD